MNMNMKAILVVIICMCAGVFNMATTAAEEPSTEPMFDTSIVETWCGEPTGTIRMVGAWYHGEGLFEDEQGNLWEYEGVSMQAFYLLWIDDMGTEDVRDDEIIKVWVEDCGTGRAHELDRSFDIIKKFCYNNYRKLKKGE